MEYLSLLYGVTIEAAEDTFHHNCLGCYFKSLFSPILGVGMSLHRSAALEHE